MKLKQLLNVLSQIDMDAPDDTDVAVEYWDDNMYDGDRVEGVRFVQDVDMNKSETQTTVFIVTGHGRK